MNREYERSEMTNALSELLTKKHRVSFIVSFPDKGGSLRLRGKALQEFLWLCRSRKCVELVSDWLERVKELVKGGEIEA